DPMDGQCKSTCGPCQTCDTGQCRNCNNCETCANGVCSPVECPACETCDLSNGTCVPIDCGAPPGCVKPIGPDGSCCYDLCAATSTPEVPRCCKTDPNCPLGICVPCDQLDTPCLPV